MEGLRFVKTEDAEGNPERAYITHLKNSWDFEKDEALLRTLGRISLHSNELKQLIFGLYIIESEPFDEILTDGEIREEVTVRIARIGDRIVEVSHCRRADSAEMPSFYEMQRREDPYGFKILVGLCGNATLRFPDSVYPAGLGSGYVASEAGRNIPFRIGDIAVIENPTAWGFTESQGNFEYLYISYPAHSPKRDVQVVIP